MTEDQKDDFPKKRKGARYSIVSDAGPDLTPPGFYRLSMEGMFKAAKREANMQNDVVWLYGAGGNYSVPAEIVYRFTPDDGKAFTLKKIAQALKDS